MIDIRNKEYCPSVDEIAEYIGGSVLPSFCREMERRYRCRGKAEFSSCSWEYGWNIKFRKSGKSLCTVYPREGYFTALVVVGEKERAETEALLPDCTPRVREIYRETRAGNGQKWLMIDLEDEDEVYQDVFGLMDIRARR